MSDHIPVSKLTREGFLSSVGSFYPLYYLPAQILENTYAFSLIGYSWGFINEANEPPEPSPIPVPLFTRYMEEEPLSFLLAFKQLFY